ncbi:hypothetical protein TrCOL_g2522 [Triparma columacea]|uniref:Uncharacterized protein n=1 Tax=Triparma columacea TaxID=722753 RepID=A0A9W7G7Z1_9STRA|nr:hypothetical protein TrCOL_g2522 [Triparma columacea]
MSSSYLPFNLPSPHRIILASASPRRSEILQTMGLKLNVDFEVMESPFDEDEGDFRDLKFKVTPPEYVITSAFNKADAVFNKEVPTWVPPSTGGSVVVVGADTVVELDGVVMEKPKNVEGACDMLRSLSGRVHNVHTGIALVSGGKGGEKKVEKWCDTSKVKFRDLEEEDIQAYVATGEPMDKAGSYGIQGMGGMLIEGMEGDFYGIMGLPMGELAKRLGGI